MWEYYQQLYVNILDNLDEIDSFLEMQNQPRLNHKEIENVNRPITNEEIELSIKKKSDKEKPWTELLNWYTLPNILRTNTNLS